MNQMNQIGIISPSGPFTCDEDRIWSHTQGVAALKKAGFLVKMSAHARSFRSYISDTAEHRLADMMDMYRDPEVNFVLCSRGGRNCGDLLDGIDYNLIKANPRPLIGFSDITVLLNAIYVKTGMAQIHGPLAIQGFHKLHEVTKRSFLSAIREEEQNWNIDDFGKFVKEGEASGVLLGGNIISLATLLGTPYAPDWKGAIFFWEEVGEEISSLHRVLTHFKNAGVWDQIGGMIIGHLEQIDEDYCGKVTNTWSMIQEHFEPYNFPIIRTELFGHGTDVQISIPVGGVATINDEKIMFGVER